MTSPRKRLPSPPSSLPKGAVREWRAVVADLASRGALDDITIPLASRYVMASWTAQEAEKVIAREGVFAVGRTGTGKPHPATGLLRSSRDTIARLGFHLGLTPTARARLAAQEPAVPAAEGDPWNL